MGFLNTWWVYLLVGIIFAYVLLQSAVFLLKARKKAVALGFSKQQINKTITSSMVLSIAPSFAILIGLVALSRVFGPMVAGLRLGTLGAVTYELPAAINVIQGVFSLEIGDALPQQVIVTALWVMTFGIIPSLFLIPLFFQIMSAQLREIKAKDSSWNKILMDSLFLGMISAFMGFVLAPKIVEGQDPFISVLGILVLLSSAVLIVMFGVLIKKLKWEWLKNYALPLSMVIAMALAIVFSSLGVL